MGKKKQKIEDNIVFFDVNYEDGSQTSRRKINAAGMMDDEVEAFAMTEIMTQDRKIMDLGGKNRGGVKAITRSA